MFNSTILDVAIGLIFVYLVLSLICTSLNEAIAQFLSLRAENLVDAIHGMFTGPDAHRLADQILNHDLVLSSSFTATKSVDPATGASNSEKLKAPSYLEPNVFSIALTSLLGLKDPASPASAGKSLLDQFGEAQYDAGSLSILKPMIAAADNDLDKARKNIETWYNGVMMRASGWYKKRIQFITFCVATTVVLIINGDTLMISNTLMSNPVANAQAAGAAKTLADALKATSPGTTSGTTGTTGGTTGGSGGTTGTSATTGGTSGTTGSPPMDASVLTPAEKQAAFSLIGWSNSTGDPRAFPKTPGDWGRKLLGFIITIFAASLGAPFWFDALNKIMNIRSAGSSPMETKSKTKPGAPGRISG